MKSKIKTEVHTHTLASHHAYCTPLEMINHAQKLGIELLILTDHGPTGPDPVHYWHFANLKCLPRKIDSLYLLRGAETNLIDYNGSVDLPERILKNLDWVIASIHESSLIPGTTADHTRTYVKALENPLIDVLGHSGTPAYSYDIDAVLEAAKRYDKAIEINNHTFGFRKGSKENCRKIVRRCAELGVNVVISTDAHSIFELGDTELAWELAMEEGIQEEQIVNLTAESFLTYLCRRKGLDREIFENTKPGL